MVATRNQNARRPVDPAAAGGGGGKGGGAGGQKKKKAGAPNEVETPQQQPTPDDNAPIDEQLAGAVEVIIPTCPPGLLGTLQTSLRPRLQTALRALSQEGVDVLKRLVSFFADVPFSAMEELLGVMGDLIGDDWGAAALVALRRESDGDVPLAALLTVETLDARLSLYKCPTAALMDLHRHAAWRELPKLDGRFILLQAWLALLLHHFSVAPAWRPGAAVDLTVDDEERGTPTPATAFRQAARGQDGAASPKRQPQRQQPPPRQLPQQPQLEQPTDAEFLASLITSGVTSGVTTGVRLAFGEVMATRGQEPGQAQAAKVAELLAAARHDPLLSPYVDQLVAVYPNFCVRGRYLMPFVMDASRTKHPADMMLECGQSKESLLRLNIHLLERVCERSDDGERRRLLDVVRAFGSRIDRMLKKPLGHAEAAHFVVDRLMDAALHGDPSRLGLYDGDIAEEAASRARLYHEENPAPQQRAGLGARGQQGGARLPLQQPRQQQQQQQQQQLQQRGRAMNCSYCEVPTEHTDGGCSVLNGSHGKAAVMVQYQTFADYLCSLPGGVDEFLRERPKWRYAREQLATKVAAIKAQGHQHGRKREVADSPPVTPSPTPTAEHIATHRQTGTSGPAAKPQHDDAPDPQSGTGRGFSLDPARGHKLQLPPDALLQTAVESVHHWSIPPHVADRLPDPGGAHSVWSALAAVLAKARADGCQAHCYPHLLQLVKREIITQCQARGETGLEDLRVPPPQPDDLEAMALALYDACPAAFEVEITDPAAGRPRHSLQLETIWTDHQSHCAACRRLGPFETAVLHGGNKSNPCYARVLMVILDGQWRLPLTREPEPFERPSGNYSCFESARRLAPETLGPTLTKLMGGVLRPHTAADAPAVVVSPLLVVLKDGDILEALHALQAVGRPYEFELKLGDPNALSLHLRQLDGLNAHIRAVVEQRPGEAGREGLKPIKLRVCTDLGALNAVTKSIPFSYFNVWDLVDMVVQEGGAGIAKMDLHTYFWFFPVARGDQPFLAVRIDGVLYVAEFCQFGGMLYPLMANFVSGEMRRVLLARGVPTVPYTDDFATTGTLADWSGAAGEPLARCADRMRAFEQLVGAWGFQLSASKSVGPVQVMPFLGITVDLPRRRLYIPPDKLRYYRALVHHLLQLRGLVPARLLESVLGCLGRVALVLISGRVRLARIRACLKGVRGGQYGDARVRLSAEARADLEWWLQQLGRALRREGDGCWAPFWVTGLPITARIFHDASGDEARGFGLAMRGRIYQGFWRSTGLARSSAYRELIPVLLALHLMPPARAGGAAYGAGGGECSKGGVTEAADPVLVVTSDNAAVAIMINKGTCKAADSDCYPLLFQIFALAEAKGVFLMADWVPREFNTLMDDLSKGVFVG